MSIIRAPIVAIAFVIDRLRRLPGAAVLGRFRGQIILALSALAAVAFLLWGFERTPVRTTLGQIAAGELSSTQSWIIISGDLRVESATPPRYQYRLTDSRTPDASVIVVADFQLPTGQQTISGQYTGQRGPFPPGYNWVGYMEAEPVLAKEQPPPWIAIVLAGLVVLAVAGGRTTYPTFFSETARHVERPAEALSVRIHTGWPATGDVVPATVVFPATGAIRLERPGFEAADLRLHSAHTSAEAGELRDLNGFEPALLLRRATGELMLGFASRAERDAAFTALVTDARRELPSMTR